MIYLTYNDQPSGVYFSQVTDVCNYVNQKHQAQIRLLAFISIRGFATNKAKIRHQFPNAIVIPMFPKQKNWRWNTFTLRLLFLFIGKHNIWSRGIFATNIAVDLKEKGLVKRVVFDGRGAYEAEYSEYLNKIVSVQDSIPDLEKKAILGSDLRLAVSSKLVDYWKKKYDYSFNDHVVIPCTISHSSEDHFPSEDQFPGIHTSLGYAASDIVFVYSGSAADWQSLKLVDDFMLAQMERNSNIRLLLLVNSDISKLKVKKKFSERVKVDWVKPSLVNMYLHAADYGILIREDSITNEVASPTKYAEYLNAGLQVLISENIGDFSLLTEKMQLGIVVKDVAGSYNFGKLAYSEKQKRHLLAQQLFTKSVFDEQYGKIIHVLKQ